MGDGGHQAADPVGEVAELRERGGDRAGEQALVHERDRDDHADRERGQPGPDPPRAVVEDVDVHAVAAVYQEVDQRDAQPRSDPVAHQEQEVLEVAEHRAFGVPGPPAQRRAEDSGQQRRNPAAQRDVGHQQGQRPGVDVEHAARDGRRQQRHQGEHREPVRDELIDFFPAPNGGGFPSSRAGFPVSWPVACEQARSVLHRLHRHRRTRVRLPLDQRQGCSSRR